MNRIDYTIVAPSLDGAPSTLTMYAGRVLLVVNVSTGGGFADQLHALEALHQRFSVSGLSVLGFVCTAFNTTPITTAEVQRVCATRYGVRFPLYGPVEVNGPQTHPLYVQLKQARAGLLGTHRVPWSFTKFLLDRRGVVLSRWAPPVEPTALVEDIQRALLD